IHQKLERDIGLREGAIVEFHESLQDLM
ncbi:unnamed protein product, partial [Rotaria sp. Silwood2]